MQNKSYTRVGEIDFFRFVFSAIIVMRNAEYLRGMNLVFTGGAFCVEFFFLVSGYLMMASVEKSLKETDGHWQEDTWRYLLKKISSFYVEFLLAYLIGFCVVCLCSAPDNGQLLKLLSNAPFELLLIKQTGLGGNSVNPAVWYIQSMMLCMVVLYPLNCKYPKAMKKIIMPLATLLLLGYLQQNCHDLRDPIKWLGLTYKGNVRAMAELCLGAECYHITKWLIRLPLKKYVRILLTVLKHCCWCGVILYMWAGTTKYDFIMLFVFTVAVILAFSRQCVDTKYTNGRVVGWMSKFSLCLYLCHMPYAKNLGKILPADLRYRYVFLIYLVCSYATALVVMGISQWLRKHISLERMKLCFLEKEGSRSEKTGQRGAHMEKTKVMIDVNHVTIRFNLATQKVDNLKEYLVKLMKGELMFQEFLALQDISFQVKKGEAWGLVGVNGSGKSTMLKVISGIMRPYKGSVSVNGSVAPLIELGAGFDPECTARENIFLNGCVLGHTEKFMQEHFDEIVEFADIGAFLDSPLKNFSSGMKARLGFAVATVVKPDILIVDEVLAVGDYKFRKKCEARIKEMLAGGTTLLYVSHSIDEVRRLCDHALWLDHGKMRMIGEANEVCDAYMGEAGK